MSSLVPVWADTLLAVVGPFSGDYQARGQRQRDSAQWIMARINQGGGPAGEPLNILQLDDRCDPDEAVSRAREVVDAGARWVVGHLCSAASLAAAPIYEAAGVVMIAPASTDPALTRQGYQRVFRILPAADAQLASAVAFLQDSLAPQRLAVIHDDQPYGELVGRSIVNRLQPTEVPVVLTASTTLGQRDFSRLVEALVGNRVDAIYYAGFAGELGLFLSQAQQQGLTVPVMGPDALASRELRKLAGSAMEGVYLTLPAALAAPLEAELDAFMTSEGWQKADLIVLATVSAVQVIAGALELAAGQTEDGTAPIRGSVYATPLGILGFDEAGEPRGFHHGVFRWQGDQVVPVNR